MTNFSEIEASISQSVGNLGVLRNSHKDIGDKIAVVREDITKRVRKKQKLNEVLRIIKAMKLMTITSENLKENHKNYDHLKIVALIKSADNVFERTLKDIRLMSNLRVELESYKTSSYEDFVNHFYQEFEGYYDTIFEQSQDF